MYNLTTRVKVLGGYEFVFLVILSGLPIQFSINKKVEGIPRHGQCAPLVHKDCSIYLKQQTMLPQIPNTNLQPPIPVYSQQPPIGCRLAPNLFLVKYQTICFARGWYQLDLIWQAPTSVKLDIELHAGSNLFMVLYYTIWVYSWMQGDNFKLIQIWQDSNICETDYRKVHASHCCHVLT